MDDWNWYSFALGLFVGACLGIGFVLVAIIAYIEFIL